MTKKKYQRYSPEFKSLALRRASEDGVTDKEVCEGLGVSERRCIQPDAVCCVETYGLIALRT